MIRSLRTFCLFAIFSLFVTAASAATYTVTKTEDTNDGVCDADCSLREAIAAANASADNDVIVFNSTAFHAPQTIVLAAGEMVISNNGSLTIYGPGSSKLTLDGNQASRIMTIGPSANAKISGITFTRGNGAGAASTGRGGAIYVFGGTAVIANSVITGNTAANGGGLNNAASSNPSTPANLTLINVEVSNNIASSSGGGIQNFSTSTVTITNSVFTGNTSTSSTVGGGGAQLNGSAFVTNSTFSGNRALAGGGGGIQSNGSSGQVYTNLTISNNSSATNGGGLHRGTTDPDFFIRNSIIAGNTGTSGSPDVTNSAAGLVSIGNNIIGNAGTSTGWIASDQLGVNPILGPLGSHGGTVRTHPLLSGSPALNAGQACVVDLSCPTNNPPVAVTTDNRYYPRGFDAGVDIGAYEVSQNSFAILPNAGLNTAYSHTIASNATGFLYAVAPGGQLPPGLALTTNGNEVLISGTPTQAGTFTFPLIVSRIPTLEFEGILYSVTVSEDPNNVFFSAHFTFNGGAIPEKFYVSLANVDGRTTNRIVPPLGGVYVADVPSDSAWNLGIRSKSFGQLFGSIAGHGSVVISEIDLAPPTFSFRPIESSETKKR